MSEGEAWGPWVEHDGQPRPNLNGVWMRVQTANGRDEEGRMECADCPSAGHLAPFVWQSLPAWMWDVRIIRYRIRKPRGLIILETVLERLPADNREQVDA